MRPWVVYLVVASLAWAFRLPWLALTAVLLLALRPWIRDPKALLAARRKTRELEARLEAHPGDLLARRQLAEILVALHRYDRAIRQLEEAIAKGLNDDEAFYLLAYARLHSGDAQGAIEPVVRSVSNNNKVFYGEPYLVAGEALARLERWEEAEDALVRAIEINGSDLRSRLDLARVRRARGNREGEREALRSALETFRQLPDYLRWKQLGYGVRALWGTIRTRA